MPGPRAGEPASAHAESPAEASTPVAAAPVAAPPAARASLASLRVADLVMLLRAMGSVRASVELIEADLEAGAPANADGTVNFVHYAAWLERLGG
jgi:hypothetical protein